MKKVYTSDSQILNPIKLFNEIVFDISRSMDLAWHLTRRNISSIYRQSLLGISWAFIMPIFTTLVWMFLSNSGIIKLDETPIPYALFTFTGTLFWQIFVDALNSPIKEIARSKTMLAKVNFPHEALILCSIGEVMFNAFIRILLVIPILIYFNINPGIVSIFSIIGIFIIILGGVSLGVFLTPLGTLYIDIGRGITIITTFWMYITPVVFPMKTEGFAGLIFKYNPMTYLINVNRNLITGQNINNFLELFIIFFLIMVLLFFALIIYRISMPHLISRIGT